MVDKDESVIHWDAPDTVASRPLCGAARVYNNTRLQQERVTCEACRSHPTFIAFETLVHVVYDGAEQVAYAALYMEEHKRFSVFHPEKSGFSGEQ
jgi:hypothetical protein